MGLHGGEVSGLRFEVYARDYLCRKERCGWGSDFEGFGESGDEEWCCAVVTHCVPLAVQAERELRAKLDNAFDSFRKKVEGLPQSHLSFEVPFRELG